MNLLEHPPAPVDILELGTTGSRHGITEAQEHVAIQIILAFSARQIVHHHGDCVGADARMHHLIRAIDHPDMGKHRARVCTEIHPPVDERLRAFCGLGTDHKTKLPDVEDIYWYDPLNFLERDERIVDESDVIIATPNNYVEQKRGSGTWATIRFAREYKRPVYIVFPNGTIKEERTKQYDTA